MSRIVRAGAGLAVAAVLGLAGCGDPLSIVEDVVAKGLGTVPSAPTISKVETGHWVATVTWNGVDSADSYNLYWAEGSVVTKAAGTRVKEAACPCEVLELQSGMQYAFIVTAVNEHGESEPSAVVTATPQPEWTPVGARGFTAGTATDVSIAVDSQQSPYVAFRDISVMKGVAMKFDGSNWVGVGSGPFSIGNAYSNQVRLDDLDKPYVAFKDDGDGGTAHVKMLVSGAWADMPSGTPPSAGAVDSLSYIIGPDGGHYVGYADVDAMSSWGTAMANGGGGWSVVGSSGFTSMPVAFTSLAFDADGRLMFAYEDLGQASNCGSVLVYNGGWYFVGSTYFSAGSAEYISMATNWARTPFIAFRDGNKSGKATVVKCMTISWDVVGSAGFSVGAASYTSLAMTPDGAPWVAFADDGSTAPNGRLSVMRFNGTSWESVGEKFISQGSASSVCLVMRDGVPWVAFSDAALSGRLVVLEYD